MTHDGNFIPPRRPGVPEAEINIDVDLVQRLVASERPDLATLPISLLGSGWDNVMMRLGSDLLIRIPRREVGGILIEREQRWLPQIAADLPIPAPIPIHCGEPTSFFPWKWSLLPWIDGLTAADEELDGSDAVRFGRFLRELHRPAPENAPKNSFRGIPLLDRDEGIRERMERPRVANEISEEARAVWTAGVSAAPTNERVWLHGDLHTRNVLVADGSIAAVIDWGDLTAGDPANDGAAIWMLYSRPEDRVRALEAAGRADDEAFIARSRAWGILFGVTMLDAGAINDPSLADVGRAILANVVS